MTCMDGSRPEEKTRVEFVSLIFRGRLKYFLRLLQTPPLAYTAARGFLSTTTYRK
jgi:hypothetical protein